MVKVLVVGQTPPPYGGQTVMIQRFLQCEMQGVELLHVRMQLSARMDEVTRFRVLKVLRLLPIICRIFYARIVHRPQVLYYAPAGPFRLPMFRDLAILLSTRWLFAKTIFHFHAGGLSELYDKLPAWQRWLFRRAYFGADAAIRIGEMNPEDGKRLQAKREYIVPNGIEDPFPDMVLPRNCPTISASRPVEILFMGILRESKGLLVLVEACGRLAARGVPFHLSIAGSPDSEEFVTQLRARIDELSLNPQITFVGVLTGKDKYAAFARADVFCMPTFYECETFGIVFVEAAACGTPVVATRWRGVPLVVDDGEVGFLVEPHDIDAVADRLAELAGDPLLRQRMGVAARRKFLREYTTTLFATRMRRVILDVTDDAPRASDAGQRRGTRSGTVGCRPVVNATT